jgi:hypothetical protein
MWELFIQYLQSALGFFERFLSTSFQAKISALYDLGRRLIYFIRRLVNRITEARQKFCMFFNKTEELFSIF